MVSGVVSSRHVQQKRFFQVSERKSSHVFCRVSTKEVCATAKHHLDTKILIRYFGPQTTVLSESDPARLA